MNPPLIIIMAAGLGKRMNSDLPKVLHCINGVPMIVKIIREASLLSPIRILVVVGKYRDIIESTIRDFIPESKNIDYIIQDPALGTGHAIKCCIPRIMFYQDFYINIDVLILSGDVPLITANTMHNMLYDLGKARIMTTTLENATGYGRVIQTAKGGFHKIVEEKDCSDEERLCRKVNVGIYAFDSYTLCEYLPRITNNNAQNEYYLTDIVELIHQKEDVQVFDISVEQQHEILGVKQLEHLSSLL